MKVALLVISLKAQSETFVRHHIEQIGEGCEVLYGGETPHHAFFEAKVSNPKISLSDKLTFRLRHRLGMEKDFRTFILKKTLSKLGVDCCYAEFGPTGVAAMAACKELGIKLIVNFHGYDAFEYATLEKYAEDYKALFAYSHKIVAVSSSMKKQLIGLGCPEHKIVYLPCYPEQKFSGLKYQPVQKQISFVGRFVEKKAPWLTLLAFQKVLEKHPDAQLVMAGNGPFLPVCKSLCETLGIANVSFPGLLNHDQVSQLFSDSMIYVQHSIIATSGDREGTPVSVMEAMLAGIPVVATEHEGIADMIENRKTGMLVPEHNIQAMADAISDLLDSSELRAVISKQAKSTMETRLADKSAQLDINQLLAS